MEDNKDFKWSEPINKGQSSEPVVCEIAIVNLPIKVVFEWSDKIVEDVDENNNPVSYRSGYIMRVLAPQTFVYNGQPRITEAFTTPEKYDGRKQ